MTATLSWWLVVELMGLAALPLAWRLLSRLPGRGYAAAKALGLLLAAYVLWLGASFRLLPNTLGGALTALAIVAAASWWLGRAGWRADETGRRPLLAWIREERGLVIAVELLFGAAFLLWTVFRAYNPEIAATEKPMEFAFINGVLRSYAFPPQDPWLSGYAISYYYFGYVMLGLLIRLTGVDPAVGFNLGVALWFALTLIGAFGVAYDLVRTAQGAAVRRGVAAIFGLLGAAFVGILGNLEALVEMAYHRRLAPESWIRWLDIKQMTDVAPVADWSGQFWWWWRASRVIHDRDLLGNSVEVIDEFPFFSFLLGDLHPHVLGLPFVLLAIALALHLILAATQESGVGEASHFARSVWRSWLPLPALTGMGWAGAALYAIALGGLAFLNTWDYPIYLALIAGAVLVTLALRIGLTWGALGRAALSGAALGLAGWIAYFPFHLGFQSQFGGILPNLLFPTRFSQFFVMFGPFLVVAVFFLWLLSREGGLPQGSTLRSSLLALSLTLLVPLAVIGAIIGVLLILPQSKDYVQGLLNDPGIQAQLGARAPGALVGLAARLRVATPWTYLALALLLAWVAGVLLARLPRRGDSDVVYPAVAPRWVADLFVVLLIGLALGLTLTVEFVYLRDLFGTRMNTVFKLYYQAWVLLALASAYGLSRLAARETPVVLKAPALAAAAVLLAAGMIYPLAATPSKAGEFRGKPTLDGLAFMRASNPAEVAAIEWLRSNVKPGAVVLEASGGSYSSEGAGRVSMSTGNPTLLGWDFHEMQWRGDSYSELVAGRPEALEQIYRQAPAEELPGLLDRWNVDFVYVGDLERGKYGLSESALERLDRALRRAYDRDGIIIYAR